MLNKTILALSAVILGLSARTGLAQPALSAATVNAKPATSKGDGGPGRRVVSAPECVSFRNYAASVQTDNLTGLNQIFAMPTQAGILPEVSWSLAELTLRLSDIRVGTHFGFAVQRLRILGGVEDGGLQTIPATRFYFSPGIIVNVPQKDWRVTGTPQISSGQMSYD